MKKSLELQYNSSQNPNYDSDFLFMTDSQIRQEYQFCLEELSREASFSLLCLIEAEFRKDFVYRTELKKCDNFSKIYRSTYNPAKKVYQYAYVDVVLNGWKQYRPERGDLINRIIDITTDKDINHVTECFQKSKTYVEVAEKLNDSLYIKGSQWYSANKRIYGIFNDEVVIL